jgi:ABC-type Fe3+/spermidine/putrescine transport system ATPase subunit
MRTEIRELQKSLGITAIYVTHDQEEAMSVSDRIALMNAGKLEQVGVPVDIYRHPVSRFAAEFMGTTNLVPGRVLGRGDDALVSLRPEALRFASDAPMEWPVLSGSVARLEWLGPLVRLDVRLGDGTILKAALLDAPEYQAQVGATVSLAYDPARLTVLP